MKKSFLILIPLLVSVPVSNYILTRFHLYRYDYPLTAYAAFIAMVIAMIFALIQFGINKKYFPDNHHDNSFELETPIGRIVWNEKPVISTKIYVLNTAIFIGLFLFINYIFINPSAIQSIAQVMFSPLSIIEDILSRLFDVHFYLHIATMFAFWEFVGTYLLLKSIRRLILNIEETKTTNIVLESF